MLTGEYRHIIFCVFALMQAVMPLYSQHQIYTTRKTPFSKPVFNDIAPVILSDGILFCSDRRVSSSKNITTFEGERLYNIYFAARKDSLNWKNPEAVKVIGSDLIYYGPVSVSADGSVIYFTSSVITGKAARKKNVRNKLGIYIGELSGLTVNNVRPFEYNNTLYNVAHPSISRDGRFLFFASDMPGGYGGSDIYYCEFVDGQWSAPRNLGNKVNSPYRENYPFIHPSGRLYFSSDRPSQADFMGGLDVYYTTRVDDEWVEPVPLPDPVNSTGDDFAIFTTDNLSEGFFARKTGGDDNIWMFKLNIIRKDTCAPAQPENFCYEFVEENALRYDTIPVPFKFMWDFGDGETAEGASVIHCYKNPGRYIVKLDVINLLTNEVEHNGKTYQLDVERVEQAFITGPDRCFTGEKIVFDAGNTYLPGWTINQFYWNFGDETIAIGSKAEKIYQWPGNYTIQLIVSSIPDEKGKVREICVSKNINVTRKP